jgi:hypothetical protein
MKRLFFISALFVYVALNAQQLASIYKGGDIKLVADASYAKNADWEKQFSDFDQTAWGKPVGSYKQIVVAPDGSVFMSHHTRHSISKFDKNGNFVKEFGKKGGKSPADFIYMPSVQGILDGKYLYTTAVDGRMHFFDLNGNWVRTIKLKYMPLGTMPMKGGKIAIIGHVPCGNGSKNIVSLLNYSDGKEKIISSTFELYASSDEKMIKINPYFYKDKDGKEQRIGNWISCSLPFSHPSYYRVRFATNSVGNLIAAYPSTGEIAVFDNTGKKIRQFKADLKPEIITKEDREEYYQNAANSLKKLEDDVAKMTKDKEYWDSYVAQYKQQLEKFRDPTNYPANLPYFSEMLVDSENNILLFRFTREEGSNKFDVYTYNSTGSKIATTSFIADDYDLKINPAVFRFHNGSIYSVLKRKNSIGNPLRLVKFDLKKN